MGIIYALTQYSLLLPKDVADIKKAIIKSDRANWELLERTEYTNRSNARISFEGRRHLASKTDDDENNYEIIFYTLSEEQIGLTGSPTRIEVIDIAVPQ